MTRKFVHCTSLLLRLRTRIVRLPYQIDAWTRVDRAKTGSAVLCSARHRSENWTATTTPHDNDITETETCHPKHGYGPRWRRATPKPGSCRTCTASWRSSRQRWPIWRTLRASRRCRRTTSRLWDRSTALCTAPPSLALSLPSPGHCETSNSSS